MRFSTLSLALSSFSAVMASAIPSQDDCFAVHRNALAEYAECSSASRATLSQCLSTLTNAADKAALEACLVSAGCSAAEASLEAEHLTARCTELEVYSDLRRRHNDALLAATPIPKVAAGVLPRITAPAVLHQVRSAARGDACFTTDITSTTICPVDINNGRATTQSCRPGQATSVACRPGWICDEDPNGTSICMEKVNKLDIGGIILAIIFGVVIVAGVGFLIFMSCAEGRAQKKLAARAEATALARAATKKKRADEVRAPLMAQQQQQPEYLQQGPGGVNPFGDAQTPH